MNYGRQILFHREIEKGISAVEILEKALNLMEKKMKHPEGPLSIALYEYAETVNSDVMKRHHLAQTKRFKKNIVNRDGES